MWRSIYEPDIEKEPQRGLEIAGRVLLFVGFLPPAWIGGTAALSLSKILDNMEIGHNVMHGQYDWMRDPRSERAHLRVGHRLPRRPVAPLAQLHAPHPHQHRGHGPRHRLRHPAHERGPAWHPYYLGNPVYAFLLMVLVPVRRCAARPGNRAHPRRRDELRDKRDTMARPSGARCAGQTLKDYVAFPLLAGPFARSCSPAT
jgi:hypothetical protein